MTPHVVLKSKSNEARIRNFLILTKGLFHEMTNQEIAFFVELVKLTVPGNPRLTNLDYHARRDIEERLNINTGHFNTILSRLKTKSIVSKDKDGYSINALYTICNQKNFNFVLKFETNESSESS